MQFYCHGWPQIWQGYSSLDQHRDQAASWISVAKWGYPHWHWELQSKGIHISNIDHLEQLQGGQTSQDKMEYSELSLRWVHCMQLLTNHSWRQLIVQFNNSGTKLWVYTGTHQMRMTVGWEEMLWPLLRTWFGRAQWRQRCIITRLPDMMLTPLAILVG